MLKIFSIGLAVIALCLAATGCSTEPASAQAPSARSQSGEIGPRLNHYDDPIIIDNPEGVVSLVPATDHDTEFAGPIASEIEPKDTSTALVLDHVAYEYIRVKSGNLDETKGLRTDKKVTIYFDDFKKGAAGTLEISFLSELNVIALVSKDYGNGATLRWKRFGIARELGKDGDDTLGLVARNRKMKYVVTKVTYYDTNNMLQSKEFSHDGTEPTEVQISLCVDQGCTFGN